MSYVLLGDPTRTAAKRHRCIWCGEAINAGTRYVHESSIFDGTFQNHKWHPECIDEARWGWRNGDDAEFLPYDNERPPSAGEVEFMSWDCALLAQGRLA